jgi:pyridoxine 5-phosphate synthase
MTRLSVNINKVAVVRNTRNLDIPSVLWAAQTAIEAGAYGITVHPRPDERHIRYSDVYELKELVRNVEFNIEGNPFEGRYMELMPDITPTQATLVPDTIGASTSDHGWDLLDMENQRKLIPVIKELQALGIRVSLFVDPVCQVVEIAKQIGADRIELYTEPFASAFARKEGLQQQIDKYSAAGKKAIDVGLGLNAGHDLNLENLGFFCKNVKSVDEVSIGHALIADALKMGLQNAVKEYLKILAHTGD